MKENLHKEYEKTSEYLNTFMEADKSLEPGVSRSLINIFLTIVFSCAVIWLKILLLVRDEKYKKNSESEYKNTIIILKSSDVLKACVSYLEFKEKILVKTITNLRHQQ